MDVPISKAARILRKDGVTQLAKRTTTFIRNKILDRVRKLKGSYTLSINNYDSSFSAPTIKVAKRNRQRFESEKEILKSILDDLNSDSVFYDIGANTGLYSIFAAHICERVVAFEPYPPNVTLFNRDINRNDFKNVSLFEVALSNQEGEIGFDQPGSSDIGYGSSSINTIHSTNTVTVPTTTVDALVSQGEAPVPNIVKIDVEGAEGLVVQGMKETLKSNECQVVYCEIHESESEARPSIHEFNSSAKELTNTLEKSGFSVETLRERNNEVFIKGVK